MIVEDLQVFDSKQKGKTKRAQSRRPRAAEGQVERQAGAGIDELPPCTSRGPEAAATHTGVVGTGLERIYMAWLGLARKTPKSGVFSGSLESRSGRCRQ